MSIQYKAKAGVVEKENKLLSISIRGRTDKNGEMEWM